MEDKVERMKRVIDTAKRDFSDDYHLFLIPQMFSKRFIAYTSMKKDLERNSEYINLLRQRPGELIESALTYALISLYGKCFTDASKNGYPKLNPKEIFEDGSELEETHDVLMDLRHQFIAHRGDTESEVGIAYSIIPKTDDSLAQQIRFQQVKRSSFSTEDLGKLETLHIHLMQYLSPMIEKWANKAARGFNENLSVQEMTALYLNSFDTTR